MHDRQLDFAFIDGQVEEFEKLALTLNPMKFTQAGKGRALGALAGGLLGAGAGAATAEEGQRGAGAIRGALAGTALGVAGGQLGTRHGRQQIEHFGKRQLHGLTGYVPGGAKSGKGFAGGRMNMDERLEALRGIGMDIPDAQTTSKLRGARWAMKAGDLDASELGAEKMMDLRKGRLTRHLSGKNKQRIASLGLRRQIAKLEEAERGLTSMPGFVKGMITDPKGTARTGLLAAGGMGAALPAAFSAPELVRSAQEGDLESFGGNLAETGFYAMSGGIPMIGSSVLGGQVRRLGSMPGAAYKRLLGRGQEPANV